MKPCLCASFEIRTLKSPKAFSVSKQPHSTDMETYKLAILDVENTVFVPETVLAFLGRSDQQGDQASQIVNVDVTPDVLALI